MLSANNPKGSEIDYINRYYTVYWKGFNKYFWHHRKGSIFHCLCTRKGRTGRVDRDPSQGTGEVILLKKNRCVTETEDRLGSEPLITRFLFLACVQPFPPMCVEET